MTTSLDERPFSPDTRKTVMISTFVGCLGLLLVVFAMTLANSHKDKPKDFSGFGCSYIQTSLDNGGTLSRQDQRWYNQHC